ncbi:nlpC/P60 family protein [[Clostridium] bifermentans ATCC 638]|uniref:NlpC/P60 family protein n=1 Tax=Paraclostridium bifermentans ATCC 638 = DSM 14991 TaxID=1233171 RepID=T4V7P4_PARBF|nr:NlpC/P60 family protein [Paraclostridium bifermentans]EQK39744.1 nlpC/P60 family protein [[Clostridium] bifermentans ATCC 638] [Paraclostridium bifermentans ATCC 638 = DSM 14991]
MSIKMICNTVNSKFDITNILKTVSWSGDIKACGRKLEFTALNKVDIPLSSCIYLYEGNTLLFKGFVYERDKDSKGNTVSYLAFDSAEKLNKIKISYNFKGKNANEITNTIFKDVGFKIGTIASANVNIDKVFIGTSVYEAIMTAYTEQSRSDGKKYMTTCYDAKISVIEKGIVKLKLSFEEGKNIMNTTFKESVSNMVNNVIIVDENGNKVSEVNDMDMVKIHGLFQDVYKAEEGKDATAEAKKLLKGVEQTCTLSGFGDTSCQTGYGVQIKDSATGLVGLFYIDSDTHTWEGGKYSIDLDLNFKNIMNEVEAGEEENKEVSSSGGTSVSGGREVQAEFTAYYPENSAMQGGFYDAMGNKLDASKLTCACPKDVPFKTKVQVKGTGTDRDGVVYTCTDRGGAIKVKNGIYHIDLLMANRKEAYAFGRRRGTALIGCEVTSGVGSSSSGSSSTGNKIVDLAKSKLGCKYVWGATGPNQFDCSGLTSWSYKQVGINIPRTSKEQSKSGKSVSRKNLIPGDLIFFNTSGKGVSHVGIYVGNGQMIHAPNSSKPVKYDSIDSSYYSSRYVNARRYF